MSNPQTFDVTAEALWGGPGSQLLEEAFSDAKEALFARTDVQDALAVLADALGRVSRSLGVDLVLTSEGAFDETGEANHYVAITVLAAHNEERANRFAFDAGVSVQRPLPEDPK